MTAGTAVPMDAAILDPGERGMSPRRIRFWFAHWAELETLADGGIGGRNLREYLAREWALLQERAGICLCGPTDAVPALPAEYGGSGFGPAAPHFSELRASLVQAVDALPIHWRATRALFDLQGRAAVWGARLATHRTLGFQRPQDRLLEPDDGGHAAIEMLARSLGWRPRQDVA